MDFPIIKITAHNRNWPKSFKELHDAPKQLYCRGNLALLNSSCFAVVGTRKLTSYGKEVARNLARDLSLNGFTIVSGLALGIDAVAHQATIDCGGKTIAILGGGVGNKNIGPRTNFPLAQSILKNDGLLISEYSDEEETRPANFAIRDRLISGLSLGVLVIEADTKSGALITAKCALDQNKDVFAVPGNILSPKSAGPNILIQNGAKLVMSAHDIINEYGDNLKLFPENKERPKTQSPAEEKIIALLQENGILFIDDIIRKLNIDTSTVAVSISMLEIKGMVKNIGNGKYRITACN